MARRLELDEKLREILGTSNTYFQPPSTITLKYPCIIYNLSDMNQRHANDKNYNLIDSYDILYITKNPDDLFRERFLMSFEYSRFERFYTADNLNHYAFKLYY